MKSLIFLMIFARFLAHRIVKFAIPKIGHSVFLLTNKKFIQEKKQEKGRRVATQSCICSFNLYFSDKKTT
jgi:hypothetical protein